MNSFFPVKTISEADKSLQAGFRSKTLYVFDCFSVDI